MVLWKIYYDDETTYSNLDGSWEDAPIHGLVCVIVRDPTKAWGRFVNSGWAPSKGGHGNEYFTKHPDEDEVFPTSDLAPFRDRFASPKLADPHVKFGRNVPQLLWEKIMHTAGKDTDFPIGTPRRRRTDWPEPE